jgi:hypothetical protein
VRSPVGLLLCLALAASRPLTAGDAVAAPPAAEPLGPAIQALQDCAARLDPDVDVGYAHIAQHCPQLSEQLGRAGIEGWLPRGWNDPGNDLSAGGLRELATLLARESGVRPRSRSPQLQSLHEVLGRLGPGGGSPGGMWRRVLDFLHQLSERGAPSGQTSWLDSLIGRIGWLQTLMRALVYAGFATVIGIAGMIIVREVRASGRLGARSERTAAARPALVRGLPLGIAEVEAAALKERPGLLLSLIVQLRSAAPGQGGLASLTARELLRAGWPEPHGPRQLEQLALMAERLRYGSAPADEAAIGRAVTEGRALLERLETVQAGVA